MRAATALHTSKTVGYERTIAITGFGFEGNVCSQDRDVEGVGNG